MVDEPCKISDARHAAHGFSRLVSLWRLRFLCWALASVNLEFAVLGAMGLSGGVLTNSVEKPFASIWTIGGSLLATVMLMNANLATYALGAIIILKLLHDLAKAVGPESPLVRASIYVGQYSLVCYIASIVFMQALSRALLRPRWELGYETIFVIVATCRV